MFHIKHRREMAGAWVSFLGAITVALVWVACTKRPKPLPSMRPIRDTVEQSLRYLIRRRWCQEMVEFARRPDVDAQHLRISPEILRNTVFSGWRTMRTLLQLFPGAVATASTDKHVVGIAIRRGFKRVAAVLIEHGACMPVWPVATCRPRCTCVLCTACLQRGIICRLPVNDDVKPPMPVLNEDSDAGTLSSAITCYGYRAVYRALRSADCSAACAQQLANHAVCFTTQQDDPGSTVLSTRPC